MTSLHAVVRRHAGARPEAVALVSGDRSVGYGELDRTADAWAHALACRGVGPGELVPVLLPRSTELVTAVLAILKRGAAYALLDPEWPERRIRAVVEELDARLVVAGAEGAGVPSGVPFWSVPSGEAAYGSVVNRSVVDAATGRADGSWSVDVPGTAAASVFFTSGTTGRPKGVVVPHLATARLFRPGTFARFTSDTVIPLAAALPWDAFSLELWGALLAGGTSLIVDEPYLSAEALRAGVLGHGVDTVWLTASLFNMIVDEDPGAFTGLRQVMTGGERLSVPHVRAFLRRHPEIALINGYGPVENTVFATTHRITEADCERPGGIPVGRPVPGTRIHLVDGEICVSGEGLALRYLGDPTLTAERFPEVTVDGRTVRVYRTGDLGEFDEDGVLLYRGRADRQVKIRGHRVEPAEVEQQIERLLPAVRHCRVVACRDGSGAAEGLLAFCVPTTPGNRLDGAAEELKTSLVHFQLPQAVISLPAFPVTATGKLDERALLEMAPASGPEPGWVAEPGGVAEPGARPEDPVVRTVAEVFSAVLGVDGVPVDVPFTELGGTSLGAGRVCARLAAALGRPVPLSRLYEHPTAAALASWLNDTTETSPADGVAEDGDVPLTPMQSVYLTRHLLDPEDRTAHCLMLWTIEGALDLDALDDAVEDVHRRHDVLSHAYLLDPEPVCRPVGAPAPALEMLPAAPDAETAAELLREALAEPLEITGADVWRAVLVPLESGDAHVLGCVVHHIAFDGWSESVLAADLAEAYNERRSRRRAPAWPKVPGAARTHRLRAARLAMTDTERQSAWLVRELTGVPELNWPGSPARTQKVPPGRCELTLERETVKLLDRVAARSRVTRFALLLSRYGRVLSDLTGDEDFAIGVPVAHRHDRGLERAVGCHIDMACIRLRGTSLADDPEAAIAGTARVVERTFAAQDVAFDEVVRRVSPPRTGRAPLFQTLFVLQDNALPTLALEGLTTDFLRPRYLEIPLEVHTEVWPLADGRLRLVVSHRPDAVSHELAHSLLKDFADLLRTLPRGDRP